MSASSRKCVVVLTAKYEWTMHFIQCISCVCLPQTRQVLVRTRWEW